MKLRIQGNSIRFRLNRREVGELASAGTISAFLEFPAGGRLLYSLTCGGNAVAASFDNGQIWIVAPEAMVREWADTDQVAITATSPLSSQQALEILIEKDFQCMHKGDTAKDPEAYPNPMAAPASS